MNIKDLAQILVDEKRAFEYIINETRILKLISCPFCDNTKLYVMTKHRLRCSSCKHDFNPLKHTWFSSITININDWLSLIKLFELEVSARKACQQVELSYPTVLKAFTIIRSSILHSLVKNDDVLKGEIEADESYFGGKRKGKRGRGSNNKTIVFGILERQGKVTVNILKDASAKSLLDETVKKVRRGSIVYTDKWKGYDSLMFCGYKHLQIDHSHKFAQGKVYINGIEGFWSFAKERIIKFHGISKARYIYYIKEMEWRYNNRDENLFKLIVQNMLGDVYL